MWLQHEVAQLLKKYEKKVGGVCKLRMTSNPQMTPTARLRRGGDIPVRGDGDGGGGERV